MVLKQTGNSVSKLQAKILFILVLILQVVHIDRIRVMVFIVRVILAWIEMYVFYYYSSASALEMHIVRVRGRLVQERHADELLLNVRELLGEARRLQAVSPGMYQPGIKALQIVIFMCVYIYIYIYIYIYNIYNV